MATKSGLNKDVWNYLFRHTRATRLYEELPQQIVEKLMGHKNMAQIYAHISSKKARDEMLKKIYHIEEMSPEKRKDLEKEVDKLKKMVEKVRRETKENMLKASVEAYKIMVLKDPKTIEKYISVKFGFDKKEARKIRLEAQQKG